MSDLCPVAVAQDSVEDEYQAETAGESHLLLLKRKKYCDVTFTFPNLPDRIEAHEFCLKARSPVFAKIFRLRKSGNVQSNEIEICDSTPEIFQQFLEFIYADKLEQDIARALDLLQLAKKYKVHPLTKKCEELLQTEIPIVDSVKVFETARHYHRLELSDRAGQIMVKSFVKLARSDALANAEEETLVYLLENNNLAVREVGLFQFILDWGRNQVGASADEMLLRNKLKNLISKIRYTNMVPEEFTKVVVPTGLLSPEDSLAVYSYLLGDEVTRRELKTKFNTIHRQPLVTYLDFYDGQTMYVNWFPAFSEHCMSFEADRTQADEKGWSDFFLNKAVITAIIIRAPEVNSKYTQQHVLNFNVSLREYCGPVEEGNVTVRFQKKLLNCKHDAWDEVFVDPPVELISGRTYSVILEDNSTSGSIESFRREIKAYKGPMAPTTIRQVKHDLGDGWLTLKEIRWKTNYYAQKHPDQSQEICLIPRIVIKFA